MQMDVEFKRNQGRKEEVWLLLKDKNREKTTIALFSHSSMKYDFDWRIFSK